MKYQGSTLAGRLAVLAALSGLASLPASADWLVTREGAKVETKGPWQVKGKVVVFHLADGSLSSMRLTEVDLDASRKATEEALRAKTEAEAAKAKPAERKAPVLVVTDKDVRHVEPSAAPVGAADEAAPADLAVANWDRAPDPGDGHVVITGTLVNSSSTTTATGITLNVVLVDEAGNPVGTGQAVLTSNVLPPGQQSGFRAEFPSVFTFSNLKFEPKSVKLETAPEPAPAASEG
ncbi:MAG TPA: FxLYD domain-containing protein [Thermoanaerobaculia bacterium]|nr:FxLYD domain-containing protein [Thermoanaerobaculia bacterium]